MISRWSCSPWIYFSLEISLLYLFLEINWAYLSIRCQHMLREVFIRRVAPEILKFGDAIISFFRVATCWLRNLWSSKPGVARRSRMSWTSCLALALILLFLHIEPLMDRTCAALTKLFVHFAVLLKVYLWKISNEYQVKSERLC